MAIFGFSKKDEDNISNNKETSKVEPNKISNPRTSLGVNDFNNIENKTDLASGLVLKNTINIDSKVNWDVSEIDKIRNSEISFQLPYGTKDNASVASKDIKNESDNISNETLLVNNLSIDNIEVDDFIAKDLPKLLDNGILSVKGGVKHDATMEPKKIETPKPVVDMVKKDSNDVKELSNIAILASSRALEIAFDLTCRYIDEPIVTVDNMSTNDDLVNIVNANPSIKYLNISDCELINDFSPIAKLKNLEQLDLSGCKHLVDLSFIKNLNALKVLNLGITEIDNLNYFASLSNLEILNLKMTKIRDLNGLAGCTNLKELILWGCTALQDISIVANFKQLRVLDLDSCGLIKDISAIANLSKLIYMNLNFTKIEDLAPIQNLTNLEIFTMDFCPLIMSEKNLSYFSKLTKMKFLGLRNRMIRNLSYFKDMTKIAELELSGNAIFDLTPLENMTEMQILNLSCNPSLVDLSPLHKMTNLKKFYISGAKDGGKIIINMSISDLSVMKNFTSLELFESNYSVKLKDVSVLRNCTKLEEVDFNDCIGLVDVSFLKVCPKMEEIYLENCTQIKDLSFVKYLKNLKKITIAKTSADRISLSNWNSMLSIESINAGEGTLPIHKAIVDSIKFRKKITKISKKVIKEESGN